MPRRPAVSAHRGGSERAGSATWEAYEDAILSGAEYVEFDIRRTADGVLVVYHDPRVAHTGPPLSRITHAELSERAGYAVPVVDDVMALIAGKLVGHLDLKEVGYERDVIDRAVTLLGADGFVATTLEDRSVAAITQAYPAVRTALSLGRDRREIGSARLAGTRLSELMPMRRVRACGASGVAVHQRLARAGVLREAARHGLFTMVWTVNDDLPMRAFLADPRVDVLITDLPRRAVALRGGRHDERPLGYPAP
ncbi:glycerophosphodiester phosphodiesterase family protein [Streptomyces sp. NL15-2K]|uniref:glycerophosphodiester phosphodiesterase family protein n=1 Tax=Streptomyces sp. NL15-2K TaxID=376149 RepID=UPI000F58BD81|nr:MULTISPECIES: glycerophosphodiester phosphodiesterase family protein [Actinomycetes]WKX14437.1 glycerophosphodiester phosphodiesterase family protein [Kutzneria buriramensis]GCB44490.1 glycerophosphoryl diester phosphodiesterase [Streptomyces sp. NL15-2K]